MRCTYGEIGRKMENFVRMSVEDLAMSKIFSNIYILEIFVINFQFDILSQIS